MSISNSAAAAVVVALAIELPAAAQETSPIRFDSGPFTGVTGQPMETADRDRESLAAEELALFETGDRFALVHWMRARGGYRWNDRSQLERAAALLGVGVPGDQERLSGGRDSVSGYLAEYRVVRIQRNPQTDCGIFSLHRTLDSIAGFVCNAAGQPVPLLETLQGIVIDGVIGG